MPIGTRPQGTHWQDWVNLVLGIWLFISPWMLNFAEMPAAAWNAWLFGLVAASMAVAALIHYVRWVEWVTLATGVWLVVSPWVLGFAGAGETRPVFDHLLVGLPLTALSLWTALAHGDERVAWE